MASLIQSVLEKAEKMNVLCREYEGYIDYVELKRTVDLFDDIMPLLLVVANTYQTHWSHEVNNVLGNLVDMFPSLHAAALSIHSPEYDGTGVSGIVPTSFALIQKELKTYANILTEFIERKDMRSLRQYKKTLEHHRTAPLRWCILRNKKCVPVLALVNDVLFEDWVPE
jgi:hypothetical protein